jgi:hypothetical protein
MSAAWAYIRDKIILAGLSKIVIGIAYKTFMDLSVPVKPGPVIPPDLAALQASGTFTSLQVSVHSGVPVTPPPKGAYLLQLFREDTANPILLWQEEVHRIGITPAANPFVRSGPGADGRFSCTIT